MRQNYWSFAPSVILKLNFSRTPGKTVRPTFFSSEACPKVGLQNFFVRSQKIFAQKYLTNKRTKTEVPRIILKQKSLINTHPRPANFYSSHQYHKFSGSRIPSQCKRDQKKAQKCDKSYSSQLWFFCSHLPCLVEFFIAAHSTHRGEYFAFETHVWSRRKVNQNDHQLGSHTPKYHRTW